MAWPFSSCAAPNIDTGPVAVPTSATSVDAASPLWLIGAHFSNPAGGAGTRTVTVTNTAGTLLLKAILPLGTEMTYEWPFRPEAGCKWSVDSGTDLIGQIWGYK